MARECQEASRNLSIATKDANGSSSAVDSSRSTIDLQQAGGAVPVISKELSQNEDRPAIPDPLLEGHEGATTSSADTRGSDSLGHHEVTGLPPKSSSTSSTSSSSPDAEGDQFLPVPVSMMKGKDLPDSLSPDSVISAKRRLWDVDREEVNEQLKRELKRIREEETLGKSSKWNFDFERELPLRGTWKWKKESEAPGFYQTKECSSTKRYSQKRFSPYERPTSVARPVIPEIPPPLPALVSSSDCVSSPSSTSSSSAQLPAEGFSLTKDYFRSAAKTSGGTGLQTTITSPLEGAHGASSAESHLSSTVTLSTSSNTPTEAIATTVTLTAVGPTPQTSLPSSSSSKPEGGDSETSPSSIPPSLFYPTLSNLPDEPDDRGGATEPSSSSSAILKTCKPPDKKKLKVSQSTSESGSPSSGSSSSTKNKSGSSPSPLLKYYR